MTRLLSKILLIIAITYCVVFGMFAILGLFGFSFVAKDVFLFFNKTSIILAFPTIAGLYLHRTKTWANFLLAVSPIAAWYLPLPSEFLWKTAIMLAVTPSFFLPGSGPVKRWIAGPLVMLLALSMSLTTAVGVLWFGDEDIQKHEHVVISTSPDKKYTIEATGNDLGSPASIPTEVKLYNNFSGSPIRRLVRVLETNYSWPAEVQIKWLADKRVMINGKSFVID